MSGDLIAFLTARLDEDERTALAAARDSERLAGRANWSASHGIVTDAEDEDWAIADLSPFVEDGNLAAHIARQDPGRALREVAAKRAILRLHAPEPFWGNNPPPLRERTDANVRAWFCDCQCPDGVVQGEYPCETVRALTAVYSDHPDYRQEWK